MVYSAMWRCLGKTERKVIDGREWSRLAEGAEGWSEKDEDRQSQLLPQFLLWVLVPRSFADLRFVSYPCTFPANPPLLIKPGGVGFYYLQLTKPRLKQMRVYFQIIEPKRLESKHTTKIFVKNAKKFTCSFSERCPICSWRIEQEKRNHWQEYWGSCEWV